MRADVALVERGLAPTRSAAQRLIAAGAVTLDRGDGARPLAKAGETVDADCTLEVTDASELRYASRGGLKLEAALAVADRDQAPNNRDILIQQFMSSGSPPTHETGTIRNREVTARR